MNKNNDELSTSELNIEEEDTTNCEEICKQNHIINSDSDSYSIDYSDDKQFYKNIEKINTSNIDISKEMYIPQKKNIKDSNCIKKTLNNNLTICKCDYCIYCSEDKKYIESSFYKKK